MAGSDERPPNRLAGETSPYLLQHARNPVDWYPWGEEAFARARAEDRPVLLSVGYSSCHWCHVMAHECFENERIAALMNAWFVNIKVDREERPDVDSTYMTAVQALTGQGGWPMTVFLTPDREPFYAGTYFPPDERFGRPGFPRVLETLHAAWLQERERLLSSAAEIVAHLRSATARMESAGASDAPVTPALAQEAVDHLRESFDPAWGGFGGAPKFPAPATLGLLLMHHARTQGLGDEPRALEMALLTLRRMATGGMYDQLGGGFARYSVDERWLVPHFEKMLYDNAQLALVYVHAWQITGEAAHERVARETLDYLLREMCSPAGGFFSAQDADSEGVEGKYYLWTPAEAEVVLGREDAALFCAWFGVTAEGNFRDPHHPELGGRSVLTAWRTPAEVAREYGIAPEEVATRIAELRARMLAARGERIAPGLDDKVLTGWNGLAMSALAEAGRVLREPRYLDAARQNAAFVRQALWRDGRLLHAFRDGVAKIDGVLDDYACYGLGLVDLFRATGEVEHLDWARDLFEALLARFSDPVGGGFFETAGDAEALLLRQKPSYDGPTPAGNSAAGLLAWWLGRYYGQPEWEGVATAALRRVRAHLTSAPTGFATMLQVAELQLAPRQELAIVGSPAARQPLEAEAARHYLPWLLLAPADGGGHLPLLEGRDPTDGRALAYVCEDMVCALPAETPEGLRAQILKG
ncbi:MAG: thioredoxin domain-containing protein [Dehalococcoidia bacterium]|nr:thioredoxin domain-containing protein [Dehalococcoidia bacterium]